MSTSFETLKIDFEGKSVENTFFVQDADSDHLAIVFPGSGYTTMAPMLYYTVNALTEIGADTLAVECGAILKSFDDRSESLHALSAICAKSLTLALSRKKYRRLTLVGKSLGTAGLAHLSRTQTNWPYMPERIEGIWLTPLLTEPNVVNELGGLGQRQFLTIGTKDNYFYRPDVLASLPKSIESLIFENADHGLDIEGNVIASVGLMKELIEKVVLFLKK